VRRQLVIGYLHQIFSSVPTSLVCVAASSTSRSSLRTRGGTTSTFTELSARRSNEARVLASDDGDAKNEMCYGGLPPLLLTMLRTV